MLKSITIGIVLSIFFLFSNQVYSIEGTNNSFNNYANKIAKKFSRTYCNTTKFGISEEGALAFAIGETNKEFKSKKLNHSLDYDYLKKTILDSLENNCQVYDFPVEKLNNLKFN